MATLFVQGIWYNQELDCWRYQAGRCVIHHHRIATPYLGMWDEKTLLYIATGVANVRLA